MIKIQKNIILKDDSPIGEIVDGVANITVEKLSNQDKGAIRKAVGDDSLKFVIASAAAETTQEGDAGDAEKTKPVADAPVSQYKIPAGQNPRLGTKTPGWKGGK